MTELPSVESVLAEHGGMLLRMASAYERNASGRDELAQEMGIAVWRALPGWRGSGSLKAFVAKVAQFTALDRHRRRAPPAIDIDVLPIESDAPGPEAVVGMQQALGRLSAAMHQLPDGQRECLLLALEGFGSIEIAHILGIRANTVDQRISRARHWLRGHLENAHA